MTTLLWLLALVPTALPLLLMFRGERRRTPMSVFTIPLAEETSASVRRFREAVERDQMLEFVWDRYSRGRALLADDVRRTIASTSGRKARRRSPIPRWI